jgi:hypothetical protein
VDDANSHSGDLFRGWPIFFQLPCPQILGPFYGAGTLKSIGALSFGQSSTGVDYEQCQAQASLLYM